MGEKIKPPQDQPDLGEVMSNFDHVVNDDVAEKLKSGGVSDYPGWDFHGTVWYSGGEYHCAVHRYKVHVATISALTCADLMDAVSEDFGYK